MLEGETERVEFWLYGVVSVSVENILLDFVITDGYLNNADVSFFSYIRELLVIVYVIFLFGSFALVGRWIYLAAKSNRDAGIEGLRYTPFSSVVWFLVPVMNLWKPYFAVKEQYLARLQCRDFPSINAKTTFHLWWMSFLVSGSLANSHYSRTYTSGEVVTVVTNAALFNIASGIALILSSLALIKIMRQFSRGEE